MMSGLPHTFDPVRLFCQDSEPSYYLAKIHFVGLFVLSVCIKSLRVHGLFCGGSNYARPRSLKCVDHIVNGECQRSLWHQLVLPRCELHS